jgi:hypothetical protein
MIMRCFTACLLLVLAFGLGCRKSEGKKNALDYGALRQSVVQEIKQGTLEPNTTGRAVLPENLKAACHEGYVYIANDQRLGLLVVFVETPSPDDPATPESGLLYCENGVQTVWAARMVQVAGLNWRLVRPEDDHFCSVAKM